MASVTYSWADRSCCAFYDRSSCAWEDWSFYIYRIISRVLPLRYAAADIGLQFFIGDDFVQYSAEELALRYGARALKKRYNVDDAGK